MKISLTNELTIAVNAEPIIIPVAIVIMQSYTIKTLNSFNIRTSSSTIIIQYIAKTNIPRFQLILSSCDYKKYLSWQCKLTIERYWPEYSFQSEKLLYQLRKRLFQRVLPTDSQ